MISLSPSLCFSDPRTRKQGEFSLCVLEIIFQCFWNRICFEPLPRMMVFMPFFALLQAPSPPLPTKVGHSCVLGPERAPIPSDILAWFEAPPFHSLLSLGLSLFFMFFKAVLRCLFPGNQESERPELGHEPESCSLWLSVTLKGEREEKSVWVSTVLPTSWGPQVDETKPCKPCSDLNHCSSFRLLFLFSQMP